jgi:guanosine-3',5'-bis(diphosphate) 3'-pyrophosphohydrolase
LDSDVLDKFNFHSEEDLYAAIGFGEMSALTFANRLTEKERREQMKQKQIELVQHIRKLVLRQHLLRYKA